MDTFTNSKQHEAYSASLTCVCVRVCVYMSVCRMRTRVHIRMRAHDHVCAYAIVWKGVCLSAHTHL